MIARHGSAIGIIIVLGLVQGSCSTPDPPRESGGAGDRAATAPDPKPGSVEASRRAPAATRTEPAPTRREVPGFEDAERRVLDATNAARAEHGLSPLAPEATLRQAARAHSADMLERGFFSHDNPDGASSGDRVATLHRRLVGLSGENIWTGSGYGSVPSGDLAQVIFDGWMSSPGHRRNILKPEYTHLGVGIVVVGREVRATQSFAEIRGLIAQAVPATMTRGSALGLGGVSGPTGMAEKFDLFSARRGGKVAGPFDLPEAVIDAAPGTYQLRFYFPDGARRYSIYQGPRIEVR